jgi:hypothetical protein
MCGLKDKFYGVRGVHDMKKKIIQWFIGFAYSIMGAGSIFFIAMLIASFIKMMESTGGEFVKHFILFALWLLAFIFYPYMVFHETKDGIRDKFK